MVIITGRMQSTRASVENIKLFTLTCLIFFQEITVRMMLSRKTRTIPQNTTPRLSILLNPPPIMIPNIRIALHGIDITDNIDNIRENDVLSMV